MIQVFYYKSPIGLLKIEIENEAVIMLDITEEDHDLSKRAGYFSKVAKQLDEYFIGKRTKFEINICPKGTDFQKRVWDELLKIPYGTTKSYQQIAIALGKENAQRAIGQTCNKNHILIIIPCHRVISKTGALRGFACGVDKKEKLLKIEGSL